MNTSESTEPSSENGELGATSYTRYSNNNEVLEALCVLEDKYKVDIESDDVGITKTLNIFEIASSADMTPTRIEEKYTHDWKTLIGLIKCWARFQSEVDSDDEEEENENIPCDLSERFRILDESIRNCRDLLLSFMKMTNCNSAFPAPKTMDEVFFWRKPRESDEITSMKPIHFITIYMLGNLFKGRYRRSDNYVMEQIFTKNGFPTHAWKEKCTIENMIRVMCSKERDMDMWRTMTSGTFETVAKYLTNCTDMEFPDLVVKRRVWSFDDGIYDATDDKFWFYGTDINDDLVSCKIIDLPFASVYFNGPHIQTSPRLSYEDIGTPLFDSIFAPQKWDNDMIKWIFIFIGRLFYQVNERDTWQVIPFLKGVAGTGKSTVIKIVQMMYESRDVGVISNNIEKRFGLSAIFNKVVFIIPEVKGDFQMDQAEFQSVVTGEELSMAVKHESPIVGQWVVPGILAGNESVAWADKSGSISRRVVVFDFPNQLDKTKIDPTLLRNIKKNELPAIIRKASLSYNWAVETFGDKDVWTALPERICKERKKLQFSTDPLYAFVNSDEVEVDQNEYVPESVFIGKLKTFATLRFPGVVITFNEDFYRYIFDDFNIKVDTCTRNWPRDSENPQRQSYVLGVKLNG